MTGTIKRYRLARPGDEGRQCWASDTSITSAYERAVTNLPEHALKLHGVMDDVIVCKDESKRYSVWMFGIVADEAPAPGEGYRLLKKLEYDGEEEEVQNGDEWWDGSFEMWKPVNSRYTFPCTQKSKNHYRRRIEPEKWTPKVGDWVKIKLKMEMNSVFISYPQLVTDVRDGECHINGVWVSMDKCLPAEPPQQPEPEVEPKLAVDSVIDSPFVTDAVKHIFAALCANPNVIAHNPRCGWSICNSTSSSLAEYAWGLARDLEFAQQFKKGQEDDTKG